MVGYIASFVMAHMLERAGSNITHANLIDIATHLDHVKAPLLLPGITLSTSPTNRSMINKFQIVRFENGSWAAVGGLVSGE